MVCECGHLGTPSAGADLNWLPPYQKNPQRCLLFKDATVVHVVQGRETGRFGPKIGVTVNFLPAPLCRRGHKHHLNENRVKNDQRAILGSSFG